MSLGAPEPLDARHRIDSFDCGKPALDTWLARYARQAQASGSAKTFVVADTDRIKGCAAPAQRETGGRRPIRTVVA